MTMNKPVRVFSSSDGVPVVVAPSSLDRTRELDGAEDAAPRNAMDEEITVPVRSSIESSLTFELLRRQSTEDDGE
jgi:hypothetical protein